MGWIKRNKDAIIVATTTVAATAVVVGVTYALTKAAVIADFQLGIGQTALIADNAGVLDKIIEHQDKLKNIMQ